MKRIDLPSAEGSASAFRLVKSPPSVRRLAWVMAACMAALPFLLAIVPWVQTIQGRGRVVAYSPLERKQTLRAPLDGVVIDYFNHQEGSTVKKGDPVFKMADNDPRLVERTELQVGDLARKVQFSEQKVEAFRSQMDLLKIALESAIASAKAGVETARNKVTAAERSLDSARATANAARPIHDRLLQLYKENLASRQEWELAERDMRKADADAAKALADLEGARNDMLSKQADLDQKRREGEAKIEEAKSKMQQASSELASALKEKRELDIKLAQLSTQLVVAPWDGTILQILRAQGADFVKKGDPVMAIVPHTDEPAVELWVDGNDAPLVAGAVAARANEGDAVRVRLQFEGWPAVQFTGWPSVAVGTFGGIVKLIDSTDDGKGKFRILVVPDPESPPWPPISPDFDHPVRRYFQYLRQGVQVNGWVLLNQVPLGWEFWRQLNGFPPVAAEKDPDKDDGEIYKRKK